MLRSVWGEVVSSPTEGAAFKSPCKPTCQKSGLAIQPHDRRVELLTGHLSLVWSASCRKPPPEGERHLLYLRAV